MSVTLTGAGGLFTRLGRIGKVLRSMAEFRAGGLGDDVESMAAEYDTLRDVMAAVTDRTPQAKRAALDLSAALAVAARDTLRRMVELDQPARSWTDDEAAAEVVRQMGDEGETVPACMVSAVATALSPFAGDGLVITTVRGPDGADLENIFQETLWLTCTADAQTGGATRGQETFRFRGGEAAEDVWGDDWPKGSGGSETFSSADPATDAIDGGNLLTNSSFDAFTTNTPDDWTGTGGAAGTEFTGPNTVNSYDGVGCLGLPGSATLAGFKQAFTDGDLLPLTRYAVAVRTKVSAAPATGTLIIEITDDAGTVVNDPQGDPLRLTVDLTAGTTSYAAATAVFVTPRALPVGAEIRVRVGTAIEGGKTAYVDHLCLAEMTAAYPGGPAAAVVAGATPFALGDGWTVAAENDRAGQDYGSTWQALWDRLFGMRELGLQLPSTAGVPGIGDDLITS